MAGRPVAAFLRIHNRGIVVNVFIVSLLGALVLSVESHWVNITSINPWGFEPSSTHCRVTVRIQAKISSISDWTLIVNLPDPTDHLVRYEGVSYLVFNGALFNSSLPGGFVAACLPWICRLKPGESATVDYVSTNRAQLSFDDIERRTNFTLVHT